ncbi:hypothetical protein [Deinococcus aestuarii]|uniref:hypothetical protein n=1 Tax=Deinococcus aestuarii TaxID=2774531 RepID=UPI001C0E6A80|nr:hypothetical protein [Deinococcus aestuarii]
MNGVLVALHLLPHLPPGRREAWAGRTLRAAPAQAQAVTDALRRAHPNFRGRLDAVQATLGGEPGQVQAAAETLRAVHASAAPPEHRPLAGRGCRYCQAACQYGHLVTTALRGQEETAQRFLSATPGSPAQQLLPLGALLVNHAVAGTPLRLDARMSADLAYCLATQLAGMRVGARQLEALRVLQERLDVVRGRP